MNIVIMKHNQHQFSHIIGNITIKQKPADHNKLKTFLHYINDEQIRNTINAITQYARTVTNPLQLKQTYKTSFPACNVLRRNEPVATDMVYSTTPAVDNGSKLAQIYVGRNTLVVDVYPIKSKQEFISTLQDNIRQRGAIDFLISN